MTRPAPPFTDLRSQADTRTQALACAAQLVEQEESRTGVNVRPVVEPDRRTVLFIAWGAIAGRSAELATALGGDSRCFFPIGHRRRPPVLIRWILSAAGTLVTVARRRPEVLIVTNPPLPAALVGWAAGRLVGARVALDSHPGSFGAQGDRVAAKLLPLHRRLAKRVDLSMVASEQWQEQVFEWGGDAVVVHEVPAGWELLPAERHERLRVLFVGHFARDEPWREVIRAAAAMPNCDIHLTGDPESAELDGVELAENVKLVGFLNSTDYKRAVERADLLLCLTTEPGSIQRSAYEAVWAGRPLVVSDWPAGRRAFPYAVLVSNDAEGIAAGIARVDRDYERLAADAVPARQLQLERVQRQLTTLRARLGLDVF